MHTTSQPIVPMNTYDDTKPDKKFRLSEFFKGFTLFSSNKIYSETTILRK